MARSISPMHGRPAILTITDIGGLAFLARDANELRHEPGISIAMHRRCKPKHRCAHSQRSPRFDFLFRLRAGDASREGIRLILFRRGLRGTKSNVRKTDGAKGRN
jgi:hypothetical protein